MLQGNEDQETRASLVLISPCATVSLSLNIYTMINSELSSAFSKGSTFTLSPHTKALALHNSVQTLSFYYMQPQGSLHA